MSGPGKRQRQIQFCEMCNQPTSYSLQACWKSVRNVLNHNFPKVGAKNRYCTPQKQYRVPKFGKINNAHRGIRGRLPNNYALGSACSFKLKNKRPVGRRGRKCMRPPNPKGPNKPRRQNMLNDDTPKVGAKHRPCTPRKQQRVPKFGKRNARRGIRRHLPNYLLTSACTLKSKIKQPVGCRGKKLMLPKNAKTPNKPRRQNRREVGKMQAVGSFSASESDSHVVPTYKAIILKQLKRQGRRPDPEFEKEAQRARTMFPINVPASAHSSKSPASRTVTPKNVSKLNVEKKKEKEQMATNGKASKKRLPKEQMTGCESNNQHANQNFIEDGTRTTLLPEGEPNCFESTTILDMNYVDDCGGPH